MTPNPRLTGRYAKSLIDLALERNQVEAVYKDILFLQIICGNKDFVNLMRSPIVKADKKSSVLDALCTGKLSELTVLFSKLLFRKGREAYLPEIVTAFIRQYKDLKDIHTVRLSTATPVSEGLKKLILEKVSAATGKQNLELNSEVDAGLIGGFVLEIGDRMVDASVAYELNNIRKQFRDNDFIYKLR
jgi:F-type H+-transporting ATPase subunit delta